MRELKPLTLLYFSVSNSTIGPLPHSSLVLLQCGIAVFATHDEYSSAVLQPLRFCFLHFCLPTTPHTRQSLRASAQPTTADADACVIVCLSLLRLNSHTIQPPWKTCAMRSTIGAWARTKRSAHTHISQSYTPAHDISLNPLPSPAPLTQPLPTML